MTSEAASMDVGCPVALGRRGVGGHAERFLTQSCLAASHSCAKFGQWSFSFKCAARLLGALAAHARTWGLGVRRAPPRSDGFPGWVVAFLQSRHTPRDPGKTPVQTPNQIVQGLQSFRVHGV